MKISAGIPRSWGRTRQAAAECVFLLLILSGFPTAGTSGTIAGNSRLSVPHSQLAPPFSAPVFVAGHLAVGGGGVVDGPQIGAGGQFIFRPGASERFLDFLYGWNCSLVLQGEYQKINSSRHIASGDIIVRHYLEDVGAPAPSSAHFVGLGTGASEVTLDGGESETGLEFVVEAGREWNLRSGFLLFWQLQYRGCWYQDHDYSHIALKFGAGIPLPW